MPLPEPAEVRAQDAVTPVETVVASATPPSAVASLAMLLPQSGAHASLVEAFVDGFLAARFAAPAPRADVRIRDTGENAATMRMAYVEVLRERPTVIVGPMLKANVEALVEWGTPPVPTLALNFLPEHIAAPPGLYQMGLAPEDEAREAADWAFAEGYVNAIALVADDAWGDRMLEAFRARLLERGGTVVATGVFPETGEGSAEPIRDVLGISASERRHRAVTAVLRTRARFEPRRRQDADFVFIAARPDAARMIVPQLRFYRAEDLPVYATSAAYDRGIAERDRDGLRFCDVPLLLERGPGIDAARAAQQMFPGRTLDQWRLFALGYDAYRLAMSLAAHPLMAGNRFDGVAGSFTAAPDGTLDRRPACAEIVSGALSVMER